MEAATHDHEMSPADLVELRRRLDAGEKLAFCAEHWPMVIRAMEEAGLADGLVVNKIAP
jgi:hypothetical protein